MHCPYCGSSERHAVKETRKTDDGRISRRRSCGGCAQDFITIEQLSSEPLRVQKANGTVVRFDRQAVRRSIKLAAVHEPDHDQLEDLVKRVVEEVYPLASQGAIPSSAIGDAVLRTLKDSRREVSQVRYALVYYGALDRVDERPGWKDVSDVLHWLTNEYPRLEHHRRSSMLLQVVKGNRSREPFDRAKLEAGIRDAAEGRGTPERPVWRLATDVASEVERALGDQPVVTSGQIAAEVMRSLRHNEPIAYLRYASTAKRYATPEDYHDEAVALRRLF